MCTRAWSGSRAATTSSSTLVSRYFYAMKSITRRKRLIVQDQYYTYTMFDVVGLWLVKHILGEIRLPDQETMDKDWRRWVARNQKLANCHEEIDFQTDFVMDLAKDCGKDFPYNLDVGDIFHAWEHHKDEDVLTYRDQSFPSKFTGTPSPIHLRNFMHALDDSLETFMNKIKK